MWCRDGRGRGDQEERRPNKWRWIRWILSFKCLKEIIKVYGNVLTWTEQTCWCMETEQCVLWQHWRHRPHRHMVPTSGHHPHWSPEHLSSVCVVSSEHSWAEHPATANLVICLQSCTLCSTICIHLPSKPTYTYTNHLTYLNTKVQTYCVLDYCSFWPR